MYNVCCMLTKMILLHKLKEVAYLPHAPKMAVYIYVLPFTCQIQEFSVDQESYVHGSALFWEVITGLELCVGFFLDRHWEEQPHIMIEVAQEKGLCCLKRPIYWVFLRFQASCIDYVQIFIMLFSCCCTACF